MAESARELWILYTINGALAAYRGRVRVLEEEGEELLVEELQDGVGAVEAALHCRGITHKAISNTTTKPFASLAIVTLVVFIGWRWLVGWPLLALFSLCFRSFSRPFCCWRVFVCVESCLLLIVCTFV